MGTHIGLISEKKKFFTEQSLLAVLLKPSFDLNNRDDDKMLSPDSKRVNDLKNDYKLVRSNNQHLLKEAVCFFYFYIIELFLLYLSNITKLFFM